MDLVFITDQWSADFQRRPVNGQQLSRARFCPFVVVKFLLVTHFFFFFLEGWGKGGNYFFLLFVLINSNGGLHSFLKVLNWGWEEGERA